MKPILKLKDISEMYNLCYDITVYHKDVTSKLSDFSEKLCDAYTTVFFIGCEVTRHKKSINAMLTMLKILGYKFDCEIKSKYGKEK